jgi:energy-coupling factor transport system ATP-binding protein
VGRDPGRADTLLRVKDLGAAYERRAVLHRVGFEVAPGETVCLLGRNGSGKTTLFRCLAGLHPGHPGSIRFFPRSSALCVTFEGQKRGEAEAGGTRIPVALCPQAPETILFKETVGAEVAATIEWSGSSVEPDALIDALGLGELIDRHPRDLSAGQRVLAATAASAATGARLLLLDEPTKGLDPVSKTHLISFLTRRAEQGDASIVATHDVEFAAEFATRVLMLAAGELIADGTPTEVLGDSAVFAPQMTRVFGPGWLTPAQVIAAVSPVSGAPR